MLHNFLSNCNRTNLFSLFCLFIPKVRQTGMLNYFNSLIWGFRDALFHLDSNCRPGFQIRLVETPFVLLVENLLTSQEQSINQMLREKKEKHQMSVAVAGLKLACPTI